MAIFYGDIRSLKTDAIVNAGNPSMLGTYDPTDTSTKSVIMQAGGLQIRQELSLLKNRTGRDEERGEAKITKAYNLPCDYVIHTVGPIWNGGRSKEEELLASCYFHSMQVALEHEIRSIAFPSISTGVYSFPVELAAKIAVKTVSRFLEDNKNSFDLVEWVLFDSVTESVYEKEVDKLYS